MPKLSPYTRDSSGLATPVLIMDAKRRVKISVEPNLDEGRPHGLYGNKFGSADFEVLKKAIHILSPPTFSNIIAIEAPKYGRGEYQFRQIQDSLLSQQPPAPAVYRHNSSGQTIQGVLQ